MASPSKSNELKISRRYDASVEAVWDAWTDPDQVSRWWGPRGFTLTTHSKDLRPGGTWVYTMHGPDGTDYPNITYYHEVRERELLVYDHGASEGKPPMFRVTVTFQASGDQTAMEMTMTLPTPEAAEEARKFVKRAGGEATWDRLAEYLEHGSSGKEVFVINRSFDAPVERVFEMWTNPQHLAQWLPPGGMQMEVVRGEIKPGGSIIMRMHGGTFELFSRAEYREISRRRIVYTQQFVDQHERISRHPFAPTWPETMLTTITLTPEGADRTRVTIFWEPYGQTSPAEVDAFIKERGGMTKGWTGSFDKLEEVLAGTEAAR
ncbi:MAG: SRPBCC family protein [Acidobacteria bacterium]|nr:SRPBCC family protein [Acidobacteriota bacterium]